MDQHALPFLPGNQLFDGFPTLIGYPFYHMFFLVLPGTEMPGQSGMVFQHHSETLRSQTHQDALFSGAECHTARLRLDERIQTPEIPFIILPLSAPNCPGKKNEQRIRAVPRIKKIRSPRYPVNLIIPFQNGVFLSVQSFEKRMTSEIGMV